MFNLLGGKAKEYHFVAHDSYIKSKFQCSSMKFYWHTATPIHLGIVWMLSKGRVECEIETEWPTEPKIFIMWPFTDKVG